MTVLTVMSYKLLLLFLLFCVSCVPVESRQGATESAAATGEETHDSSIDYKIAVDGPSFDKIEKERLLGNRNELNTLIPPTEHDSAEQYAMRVRSELDSMIYDDGNSPMVHEQLVDYSIAARRRKAELLSEGKEAVLKSELSALIPRTDGESDEEFDVRRRSVINDMIRQDVRILDDEIQEEVATYLLGMDRYSFNVGPESGITKKEYWEFWDWFNMPYASGDNIPPRFSKYGYLRKSVEDNDEL